ncbi:Potassium/sodium hyperpolarization-activated cyclic nucleotide-gated channel 1 [Yarrowia sp. B02]|nr:Potassium/sodium hyperpolarization-activated cyclic nucleotide-gated channel 1 [Yarrowia sp. B02]
MAYRRKKFFGKRADTGHVARTPSQLQEVYSDDDDGEGEDVEMWDQPEVKAATHDQGSPAPPANPMGPRMSDSLYQETKAEAQASSAGPQGAPGDLYSLIRTFPLFKMAPNAFVIAVSAKLRIQQVSPQEYIVTQGDEAKAMYWILKGQVNVTSRDGESVYAELEAGSFFGEIGILFDRPRTATVLASTKCVLAVLKGDSLNDILPKFPAMERAIRDEAQERLAIIEKTKINQRKSLMSGMVSPTTSIRNLLHEMPLFRHIPETIVHKLALAVEPRSYEPFQYIIKQDTIGQEIYFLTSGIVEVIDERELGTAAHIIARLTKGSYFGEMAFLSSNPVRTASIRSISMVECLVLTTDTLESLCSQYPDIQQHIEQTASARIEQYQREPKPHDLLNNTHTQPQGPIDMTRRRSVADFSGKKNDSLFTVSRGGATFFSEPRDEVSLPATEPSSPLVNNTHTRRYSTGTVFEPIMSRDGRVVFSNSWESSSGVSEGAPLSLGNYQMVQQQRKCLSAGSSGTTSPSKRPAFDTITRDDEPQPKEKREVSPREPSSSPPNAAPLARSSSTGASAKAIAPQQRYSSFLLHPRLKKQKTFQRRKSSLFNVGPFSDAIQVKIFAYLDLPDLMVLQRVCQHWRQLLLMCPLNELDLKPYNRSIDDTSIVSIVNFVGARPKIVDISSCFHLTDDGFSYLVNGIGLAKIRVFKMTSVWEVSGMAIMDLTVPSIGADLEEVDLSNCRKVGDSTLARLVGWVQEEGAEERGGREMSPSSSVVGCPKLKRITISYCKHITDRSMHHMAVYAADRLEMLNLTRCTTITDHGFGYWNIRPFTRLKELVLADCTFLSDKAIISIVGAAKNLEFLDLSFCCALSDVSVEVLSLGCPSLKSLNLSFCGSAVSDANLRAVAMHLLDLEHLSVRGCVRVTAVGVDTVLAGCLKLKTLDITQCKNAGGWNQGDSKVVVKTT